MMRVRPVDDAGYFHARALEEQIAARNANCAAARFRHDELAAMYRFKELLLKSVALRLAETRSPDGLLVPIHG